ncbi:MAG: sulfite oxidase [Gemmatimonadales bacterium]
MTLNPALPGKDSRLVVKDPEQWNAGPPPSLLREHQVTPASLFFIRSHAPTPEIDPLTWRLRVRGLVRRPLELSLSDLRQQFLRHDLAATLVCAGLRRAELVAHRPVPGELLWGADAISNGWWSGVALRDVLMAAGATDEARHVAFTGLDQVSRHDRLFGFGGSIPLEKAMAPEALLAFDLNGEALPPAHGYPLRAVVPGYIGARSVKWLGEIVVEAQPSTNYFQTEAYRVLREPDPDNPRSVAAGEALGTVPLNAVIVSPEARSRVAPGLVEATGWAFGGAAERVARVEVSPDNGATWVNAVLEESGGAWSWTFWRAAMHLRPGQQMLVARAWDQAGHCQPAELAEVWNVKGYTNTAWHRVAVDVSV